MSTPEPARWTDGEPANLAAAATDALEWLEYLCQYMAQSNPLWRGSENRRRLERCIEALRQHLPREDGAE